MGGRARIGRGVEVVAERGAERRLEPFGDADLLDDRRPLSAGRRAEQLGQRTDFGFEPLRLAVGLGERAARARLGLARMRMRALRIEGLSFRIRERRAQRIERSRARFDLALAHARAFEAGALARDAGAFLGETRET